MEHRAVALRGLIAIGFIWLCNACGGVTPIDPPNGFLEGLPWPPGEQNIRQVSDDTITVPGIEFSAYGGDVIPAGYPVGSVYMESLNPTPWAMYSLGGFDEDTHLGSVEVNFQLLEEARETTQIYLGIANYARPGWEWFLAEEPQLELILESDADYVSPGNTIHVLVYVYGPGPCILESLVFSREGNTSLMPPNGLEATAKLGSIDLQWQPAPNAESYYVYRDIHQTMPSPVWLNEGNPVTDVVYTDETVEYGVMYYYFIRSVNGPTTSPPSAYVDIFSYEYNEDFTYDLGSYSYGPENFFVTWDFPGYFPERPPVKFLVYYSTTKDFNLTDDAPTVVEVPGYKFKAQLDIVDGDGPIWWRVCAANETNRGPMTDDIEGVFLPVWEWGEVEVIGTGHPPFSVVKAEGGISLAYIRGFENPDLRFSHRTDGEWDSWGVAAGNSMSNYVSMAYSSGEYLIAAQHWGSHDAWAFTGQPGSFDAKLLHGDGSTADFHPVSGENIQAVASQSEVAVVHVGGEEFDSDTFVYLHTKPIGGDTWDDAVVLWDANYGINHLSMAATEGNFYLLWQDAANDELLFADRSQGWDKFDILSFYTEGFGQFTDLTWFNDEWWSPVYNSANGTRELYIIHGTDSGWPHNFHDDDAPAGEFAVMEAMETKLACAYYKRYSRSWELAIFDGSEWFSQMLIIHKVPFSRLGLSSIGDLPYVVVDDRETGVVKGYLMVPPE